MTGFKILLVEDTIIWQDILQEKLREALQGIDNSEITLIGTFNLAKKALQEKSWDLLVTDIGLGSQSDSSELKGKFLIELACERNIPAIAVSGTPSLHHQDVSDLYSQYGVAAFFHKQRFINKNFIDKVRQILFDRTENISVYSPFENSKMEEQDRKYIIDKLANLAASSGIAAKDFFRGFVNNLGLPEQWKQSIIDIWSGNANSDAEKLVNWIEQKHNYPNDCKKPGYTPLGSLTEQLLHETGDYQLLKTVTKYKLIDDKTTLNKLKCQYSLNSLS